MKNTTNQIIRLCKIVWNDNGWIQPIRRKWNANNSNRKVAFEKRVGFVHEDWLFNSEFLIQGYQYGWIEGLRTISHDIKKIDKLYLFSINPNTKERLIIGILKNVEIINSNNYTSLAKDKLKNYFPTMISHLKNIGADYSRFTYLNEGKNYFNMRVNQNDIELLDNYIQINDLTFRKQFNRTNSFIVDDNLQKILDGVITIHNMGIVFKHSKPRKTKNPKTRKTSSANHTTNNFHDKIVTAIYKDLLDKGFNSNNISCEATTFGGKIADIVLRINEKTYSIFEIKTEYDFRKSLREAIGQLLDYSSWDNRIMIQEINAVLPEVDINPNLKTYIRNTKKSLNIKLNIILYNENSGSFKTI